MLFILFFFVSPHQHPRFITDKIFQNPEYHFECFFCIEYGPLCRQMVTGMSVGGYNTLDFHQQEHMKIVHSEPEVYTLRIICLQIEEKCVKDIRPRRPRPISKFANGYLDCRLSSHLIVGEVSGHSCHKFLVTMETKSIMEREHHLEQLEHVFIVLHVPFSELHSWLLEPLCFTVMFTSPVLLVHQHKSSEVFFIQQVIASAFNVWFCNATQFIFSEGWIIWIVIVPILIHRKQQLESDGLEEEESKLWYSVLVLRLCKFRSCLTDWQVIQELVAHAYWEMSLVSMLLVSLVGKSDDLVLKDGLANCIVTVLIIMYRALEPRVEEVLRPPFVSCGQWSKADLHHGLWIIVASVNQAVLLDLLRQLL